MNGLYLRMILAGIGFGLWPLFMNRSGLGAYQSSVAICFLTLVFVLPFSFQEDATTLLSANWWAAAASAACSAIAVLLFNSMVMKATPQEVGRFCVIMVLAQISVPAIYHCVMAGGVSLKYASGFIATIVALILLS